MYHSLFWQVAEASDVVDREVVHRCFDEVIVPIVKKFQVNGIASNIGTYILAYVKAASMSEVR